MRDEMIVAGAPLVYWQFTWGDCIIGTKQQLQALGLAVGRAYPGELGGAGKGSRMRTLDRYGYKVEIKRDRRPSCEQMFTAHRYFPNWPERPYDNVKRPFAPGVRRRMCPWWDEYFGTGSDLVAAGVLSAEHVSALAASGRKSLTVYADGTLQTGPIACSSRRKEPGCRRIQQTARGTLEVRVMISYEEHETRAQADKKAERDWEAKVSRLQRPPRLTPVSDRVLIQRRAAEAEAARDVCFQGMLSKLVDNSVGARHHG
jgi:hypothetical protein